MQCILDAYIVKSSFFMNLTLHSMISCRSRKGCLHCKNQLFFKVVINDLHVAIIWRDIVNFTSHLLLLNWCQQVLVKFECKWGQDNLPLIFLGDKPDGHLIPNWWLIDTTQCYILPLTLLQCLKIHIFLYAQWISCHFNSDLIKIWVLSNSTKLKLNLTSFYICTHNNGFKARG